MVRKKVCLLGAFAAGKTSLVRRCVHGTFSDVYLTTIGVKIDKLTVETQGELVQMVLWDLHGEDRFQTVQSAYMRGAAGFLIVADSSRPETFEVGKELEVRARAAVGDVPMVWVANKADLLLAPNLTWPTAVQTSARTGQGVHTAFKTLATAIKAAARGDSIQGGSR